MLISSCPQIFFYLILTFFLCQFGSHHFYWIISKFIDSFLFCVPVHLWMNLSLLYFSFLTFLFGFFFFYGFIFSVKIPHLFTHVVYVFHLFPLISSIIFIIIILNLIILTPGPSLAIFLYPFLEWCNWLFCPILLHFVM